MYYKPLSKLFYSDKKHYEEIYQQRYYSEAAIRFNFFIKKQPAFMLFTPELFSLLNHITRADKKVTQLAEKLPETALYQYSKKCLVDEILLTNDIEGVVSTRNEVNETLEASLKQNSKQKKRFYGLMQKYLLLLNANEKDIPLKKCEDIRNLYNEFILEEVKKENPKNVPDGIYFRLEHVDVVSRSGKSIHHGLYPEAEIITMMEQSLSLLNDDSMNDLIRIAIFHYLFAYIHPFYDGNGRMTRFISSYLLSKHLYHLTGFRLSYTIKRNIDQYYKSFRITNDPNNKGDLTPFVISFFEILVYLMDELYHSLEKRTEQMKHYLSLVENHAEKNIPTENILAVLIINTLFGTQGLSIQDIVTICGISSSTVRKIIHTLDTDNMLRTKKEGHKYLYDIELTKL